MPCNSSSSPRSGRLCSRWERISFAATAFLAAIALSSYVSCEVIRGFTSRPVARASTSEELLHVRVRIVDRSQQREIGRRDVLLPFVRTSASVPLKLLTRLQPLVFEQGHCWVSRMRTPPRALMNKGSPQRNWSRAGSARQAALSKLSSARSI